MRVEIKKVAKKESGLLSRKEHPAIQLTVTFSNEEKQIIEENELYNLTAVERNRPADVPYTEDDLKDYDLRLRALLEGPDIYAVSSNGATKNYIARIKDGLAELKETIDFHATAPEDEVYEL